MLIISERAPKSNQFFCAFWLYFCLRVTRTTEKGGETLSILHKIVKIFTKNKICGFLKKRRPGQRFRAARENVGQVGYPSGYTAALGSAA